MRASPSLAAHDAHGRCLWQSAGFFGATPAAGGMNVMRAGRVGISAAQLQARR